MKHFFFNLHLCDEVIPDPEGAMFEDVAAAVRTAKLEARSYLAAEVAAGKLCIGCYIKVVDAETGESVDVPFRSMVTIKNC